MDATRLPDPPAAVAAAPASAIGGRFVVNGPDLASPTGVIAPATDSTNGAQVMLKIVTPAALPTGPMADRALRELKQLAKVTSERVVRVLDQGKTDDGRVYVASELVDGRSLEQLVAAEGPLPLARAAAIVLQVGEALTEAQKVGVIHRDVNPRNVLVGSGDRVKVSDFGLAEPVTDKVFGSPAYLSPEQVEGRPVDQRSNIYSLGAILYFAVTGEPPFSGDAQSLLQQHLSATPQPPSQRKPGLPPELDKVVLKALEKSGGRRHLTLRQLLTELEAATGVKAADVGRSVAAAPAVAAARPQSETVMGMPAIPSPKADAGARTMMAHAPAAPAVSTPVAVAAPAPVAVEVPVVAPVAIPIAAAVAAPAPVAVPVAAPAAAPAASSQKKGSGFRETAWFKQGEIDEEMAKRQAAQTSADPLAPTGTTGQHDQIDSAKLSAEDAARLSLKTGSTQALPILKTNASGAARAMPGERMDEAEMLAEIDSSKKWLLIAAIAVGVVVAAAILYFTVFRGAPAAEAPPPEKPPALAVAPPAVPTPAPAAVAPVAPIAPAAPATKPTAGLLLAQAQGEMKRENWGAAVDAYLKAAEAGADVKELRRVDQSLSKGLLAKAVRAHKRKDKASEADARALMGKLHPSKKR